MVLIDEPYLNLPDLPGWPLFSPAKVQLQKCEKCSREFCSMINYRRHILVHRRTLKIDKVLFSTLSPFRSMAFINEISF